MVALTATDGRTASKTRPTSPCVFTVPSPIHDGSRPTVAQFHFGPFDFGPVRLWPVSGDQGGGVHGESGEGGGLKGGSPKEVAAQGGQPEG